jgi:hypothetical protein
MSTEQTLLTEALLEQVVAVLEVSELTAMILVLEQVVSEHNGSTAITMPVVAVVDFVVAVELRVVLVAVEPAVVELALPELVAEAEAVARVVLAELVVQVWLLCSTLVVLQFLQVGPLQSQADM